MDKANNKIYEWENYEIRINNERYKIDKLKQTISDIKISGNNLRNIKNEINEIRKIWKNRKIELITKEIRDNIKKGDSKMVWKRINQLKNSKIRHMEIFYLQKMMGN